MPNVPNIPENQRKAESTQKSIGGIRTKMTLPFAECSSACLCFLSKKSNAPNKSIQITAMLIRTGCGNEFIFSGHIFVF